MLGLLRKGREKVKVHVSSAVGNMGCFRVPRAARRMDIVSCVGRSAPSVPACLTAKSGTRTPSRRRLRRQHTRATPILRGVDSGICKSVDAALTEQNKGAQGKTNACSHRSN